MKEPRYGWVMVALGALMTCIAIGAVAIALAFPPVPTKSVPLKLKELAT